jgi:hypothetical protein
MASDKPIVTLDQTIREQAAEIERLRNGVRNEVGCIDSLLKAELIATTAGYQLRDRLAALLPEEKNDG